MSRRRKKSRQTEKKQGFALLLSLIALAILAVLVTDLHETTSMSFTAAMAERDQLRAEYLAKSGVNLTRMLVGQERNLRQLVNPIYQAMLQRPAPQIPVWRFADIILKPFSDFEASKEDLGGAGFDLGMAQGLGKTGGSFEITAMAENGKINVNDPRIEDIAVGHANVAQQLYSLMGGYQPSPNKLDPLFSQFDEKGRMTTRLDVLANVIDWWDLDEQRTQFDPVLGSVQSSGGEDADAYKTQLDPYAIKNAPFDTIEELRLVRGVNDDFWSTFVEPDPDDATTRQVTIYGLSKVNPNEAEPAVILARVCTFFELHTQPLCSDPAGMEALKFITLLQTARSMAQGIPWFSKPSDFVKFITGDPSGLYGKLSGLLQGMGAEGMLFTPLVVPEGNDLPKRMRATFAASSRILTIESVGRVGNAVRRIRTVINTDPKWTPPPPNAGKLPELGIFSYYRID